MSILKRKRFSAFFDLFFPPLCMGCEKKTRSKYLCDSCWLLCSPIDPLGRCRHCFDPIDEKKELCLECRTQKGFLFPKAYVFEKGSYVSLLKDSPPEGLAGFFTYQYIQLDLLSFDLLIATKRVKEIGKLLSTWLEIPFIEERRDVRYLEEVDSILLIDWSFDLKEAMEMLTFLPHVKRLFFYSLVG